MTAATALEITQVVGRSNSKDTKTSGGALTSLLWTIFSNLTTAYTDDSTRTRA